MFLLRWLILHKGPFSTTIRSRGLILRKALCGFDKPVEQHYPNCPGFLQPKALSLDHDKRKCPHWSILTCQGQKGCNRELQCFGLPYILWWLNHRRLLRQSHQRDMSRPLLYHNLLRRWNYSLPCQYYFLAYRHCHHLRFQNRFFRHHQTLLNSQRGWKISSKGSPSKLCRALCSWPTGTLLTI